MAKRKTNSALRKYLVATGMMFPTDVEELELFNKNAGVIDKSITGKVIDPFKIIADNRSFEYSAEEKEELAKCAKHKPVIPEHIKEKMIKSAPSETNYTRTWKHKSVEQLILETGQDPIEAIKGKARSLVLDALEKGWSGPPFSAIELAKLLGIDIVPDDDTMDARTKPKSKGKFVIEYNPFQMPTRMNFSIAHEITHTLFSDCGDMIRNREEHPDENRELEQLCNIGASELQLPYVIFPHDANALPEINSDHLIELAKKYKSSLESTFLAFVSVIDKPCAIIICTFTIEKHLSIDYYKASSTFEDVIPKNFKIPTDSSAYYCIAPGHTERETVKWSFLSKKYDAYYVGLSPMRRESKGRVGIIITPNDGREDLQLRKIKREFGDATKPQGKGTKIIAQVVNTTGSLGRGFGKSLSKNFPIVATALEEWKRDSKTFKLGNSQLLKVSSDTYVVQMLAQKGLFPKDGEIPLKYVSLQQCLADLRSWSQKLNASVYMPLIGAGNAQGKWEIIEGLIYSELVNFDVKVTIYVLNQGKTPSHKSTLSFFNESSTWRKEK
jgi:hypothetical protein